MSSLGFAPKSKLREFLELSSDGYAIFDEDDRLTYCNAKYAELMNLDMDKDFDIHWDSILRANFILKRGVKVDSGNIEAFIKHTHTARRSRPYRLFEVDFVDGRWFLFSEQTNETGEMLMQIKELTKQKLHEEALTKNLAELRHQATTDELTRVGNRRALIESVASELNRCRRTGASMSMLLFDLDYFKKVNDDYSHQAGDEALKHVASILKNALRPYDILGRIGGEEFAIFLSNTKSSEALEIAERIRKSIQDTNFRYEGKDIPLSVSAGTSTLGCDTSFEELYKQADEALYDSKSNGRNRVSSFSET